MSASAPKSGSAITACVLGILGFLSCGITSLPAIIFGHIARSRIRRSGGAIGGGRLALAGLVMGYLSLVMVFALLALGILRAARERAQLNRTVATHAVISAGLELYKEKFGEYPVGAKSGIKEKIANADFDLSGALMLYQALTGDGSDMIRVDGSIARPSNGKIDEEEVKDQISMSPLPASAVLKTSAGYIVVDGYGHPFQYTPSGSESVNPTYDLWSFGSGNSPFRTDKAAKQDAAIMAKWIKNW